MNSKLRTVTAIFAIGLMASLYAGDGHSHHGMKKSKAAGTQTTCPVMGGKINKALYADVNGKRIYVCCKGCIAPIKKNPEKYIKKLEKKGEAAVAFQSTCPVMGGKINKAQYVDVSGKRIYVCCAGCQKPIQKDPAKYIKKITDAGELPYDIPKKEMKKGHSGHHH